ncbi:unnamed protein product [Didymodactylos carnosus]|uniref:Uncharacterized protein n=1 Tax=Didymodactylos carnosus TaxID=1234261 RepID=A0A8S2JWX5_9BILA|nr:unnamed protein product [Didymodactylos carnosus]CAF3817289.1 unnamed protein product [Didymodactylos carnosus]
MKTSPFVISTSAAINKIHIDHTVVSPYRTILLRLLTVYNQDVRDVVLFKRYKTAFITYHSTIYDEAFNCVSCIVSFWADHSRSEYGNIILFYQYRTDYFAFVQKYEASAVQLSQLVNIPVEMNEKLDELFPLVSLTDNFVIVPMYDNLDAIQNDYVKMYTTSRRSALNEKYKLVIFPSDNTFSIVKDKQCTQTEHGGLIFVHDGSKKYKAMVFKEGTMTELSKAATLLNKVMNTDIESDFDPDGVENRNKAKKIEQTKCPKPVINLNTIPFGGLPGQNKFFL